MFQVKIIFLHIDPGLWTKFIKKTSTFSQIGMRVVYNLTKEISDRVVSIDVITSDGRIPKYEPLDLNKSYHCIAHSFLADGGDGFDMVAKNKTNHRLITFKFLDFYQFVTLISMKFPFLFFLFSSNRKGSIDIDVVIQYLKDRQVIYTGLEDRIKFI